MNPAQFIDDNQISFTFEFIPLSRSRSNDKRQSINWLATLYVKGREIMSFDYAEGVGCLPHYESHNRTVAYDDAIRQACETRLWTKGKRIPGKTLPDPSPTDPMHCLIADSHVLDAGGFDAWCSEYEQNTDCIKARAMYDALIEQSLKLNAAIDMDAAREAFQDY